MQIKYIVSRAGGGKTRAVYEDIRKCMEQNQAAKLVLMVPEQFTLQAETDIIASLGSAGIMQLEVLSFQRLAHRILSEVGGIKRVQINQSGKAMLLRSIIDANASELTLYAKASRQEGFLSKCSALIDDLKRQDIDPQNLMACSDALEEGMLRLKLRELGLIYEKYTQALEEGYVDEHDWLRLLSQRISSSRLLEGAHVWIDGFSGFSAGELSVIGELVKKAAQVSVSLTLDMEAGPDYELFAATRRTIKAISASASEAGAGESTCKVQLEGARPPELLHLERNLYAYPFSRYAGSMGGIRLFAGSSRHSEVENAAIEIIKLASGRGYRWRDIAIVTGALEDYAQIIKRTFSEYGIPVFIDEKRPITNNPITRFVLAALDIAARDFRYEDVFKFIKTGFTELERSSWERLENYVLRYGIKSSAWLSEFALGSEEERSLAEEARIKLVPPLAGLKKKLGKKKTVKEFTSIIYDFMVELDMPEKIERWTQRLMDDSRLEYVNENTQIWNIVIEIFDQMVEMIGDMKVDIREYAGILSAGFAEHKIGVIPPTMDQVIAGSLERSKSHEIKALFVLGVNDGVLPGGFSDEELILDDEKLIMKENGVRIATDSITRAEEEKFSIYTSFSKPSELLHMSYAIADEEGKALRPSIIADRMKKLYAGLQVESDIVVDSGRRLEMLVSPFPGLRQLSELIRQEMEASAEDNSLWRDLYSWYASSPQWSEKADIVCEGLFHKNQQEYIGGGLASRLYASPLKSSISRLERFANCPFAHFVNYGLSPRERPEYTVSMPDMGTLFHSSVEKFSKEISDENISWRELEREKSDEIVERVIDSMVPEFGSGVLYSSHRYSYLVNKIKRVGKRAAWAIVEHIRRGEFAPLDHEVEFSECGSIPAIVIELPGGEKIELAGRIDRVDILGDGREGYVKIIDYKSGSKKFTLSDAYYGLQIQLLVYMDALLENKQLLEFDELHPAGVFYFRIDDPLIDADKLGEDDIEKGILKQLKMNGIVLKDVSVVKAMDSEIENERYSSIIPAEVKKDGEISERSSAVSEAEFRGLIGHVKNLICEIGSEILKGKIKIQPCRSGSEISCSYCKFKSICQFDTLLEDNEYRNIKKLSDTQVRELLSGKESSNDKVD